MLLILLACLTPRQSDQLLSRNFELAAALDESESKRSQAEAELAECQTLSTPPTAAEEIQASAMLVQANEALAKGDALTAKGIVAVILSEHGSTQAARGAERQARELAVVGLDAVSLDQVEWWQGQHDPNAQVTLLVFWEQWCPHCRREMPKTNLQWQRYKDQGLQVIALTEVTNSSTDESARALIVDQDIGFAVGKEEGSVSEAYLVSGIPAAVVIQDGKVIWRGHPGKISDEAIQSWLE